MSFAIIIDDDVDDAKLLSDAINDEHPEMQCVHYGDSKDALAQLEVDEATPDFIFLDINMPGFDGHECLLRMRQSPKYITSIIIMLSTGMDNKLARILKRDGANYAYPKPIEYSGYGQILKVVIG